MREPTRRFSSRVADYVAARPGYPRAIYGLARVYVKEHNAKDALRLARRIVKLRPGQSAHHLILGDAYARKGRIEDARASWDSARRALPAPHAKTLAPLVDVLIDQRLRRTASPRR